MNTLASLIRAHERDPRVLYVAPRSERESAPGRYDSTASQRSPALERREEREAARGMGKDLFGDDFDPSDIRDYDDLQDRVDAIHDGELEPTPDVPAENLPLEQPEGVDPADAEPKQVPPVEGVQVYALMDGRLAYSPNGGAQFKLLDGTPPNPIGISAPNDGPIVIADEKDAHWSRDLATWTKANLPLDPAAGLPLINPDFENRLDGWEFVSGTIPTTIGLKPPKVAKATNVLTRDFTAGGTGAFTIRQTVDLDALGEVAHDTAHGYIQAFVPEGSEIELTVRAISTYKVFTNDPSVVLNAGLYQQSSPVRDLRITGYSDFLPQEGELEVYANLHLDGQGRLEGEQLRVEYEGWKGEISWDAFWDRDGPPHTQMFREASPGVLETAREIVLQFNKSGSPSCSVVIPEGWRPPLTDYSDEFGFGRDETFYNDGNHDEIDVEPVEVREVVEAKVLTDPERADEWQEITTSVAATDASELEIEIASRGSPADGLADDVRVTLVADDPRPLIHDLVRDSGRGTILLREDDLIHYRGGESEILEDGLEDAWQHLEPVEGGVVSWSGSSVLIRSGEELLYKTLPGAIDHVTGAQDGHMAVLKDGRLILIGDEEITPLDRFVADGTTITFVESWGGHLLINAYGGAEFSKDDGETWIDVHGLPNSAGAEIWTNIQIVSISSGRIFLLTPGASHVWWREKGIDKPWNLSPKFPAPIIEIATSEREDQSDPGQDFELSAEHGDFAIRAEDRIAHVSTDGGSTFVPYDLPVKAVAVFGHGIGGGGWVLGEGGEFMWFREGGVGIIKTIRGIADIAWDAENERWTGSVQKTNVHPAKVWTLADGRKIGPTATYTAPSGAKFERIVTGVSPDENGEPVIEFGDVARRPGETLYAYSLTDWHSFGKSPQRP